jgi:tetratricopeptide (TPR) repeat protein
MGRSWHWVPISYLPCSSFFFYSLTLVFFALGLMSKPMLVTVPLILLLLDYWPLRRLLLLEPDGQVVSGAGPALARVSLARALLEKLPLFMMSAASAAITVAGHKQLGSLVAEGILPFSARLGNALVSYVRYLQKAFWPTGLAVHYPHPGTWPPGVVAAATAILVAVSVWALVAWRRRPYLLIGWLWFLVALLPTIGIIQASSQAMADRFAYVPLIGVFVMLVWLAGDLMAGWRYRVTVEAIVMLAVLLACLVATSRQLTYWSDGEALFRRAVAVTQGNYLAEYSLGCALGQKNKLDDALDHFTAALKIKPDYAEAHDNRGVVLQMQGQSAAAEAEFLTALRLKPDLVRPRNNLGLALQAQGKTGEALAEFRQVLRAHPDNPEAHNNLGKTLAEQGKVPEAMTEFEAAIRLKPDYAGAHFNLGNAFVLQGKPAEAVAPYLAALQAQPDFSDAHQALGLVLAALGQTNEAAEHFSAALRLKPGDPEAHYGLGDLLLRQGKTGDAAQQFRAAIKRRPDYPEAHYQLGVILAGRRETAEAIAHYREAVRLKPDWLEARNNLAWILATQPDEKLRDGPEAVRLAAHAVTLTRTNNPGVLDTLAAAYAEAGRFPEAAATAQKAAELALAAGQKEMAAEIQRHRQSYASGRPFRE